MKGPYKIAEVCDCQCNSAKCALFVEGRGMVCSYCSKHHGTRGRVKRKSPKRHRYTNENPDF